MESHFEILNSGGIAKRLINLAMLILGRVPGSLALTNVAANAMFGSLSDRKSVV